MVSELTGLVRLTRRSLTTPESVPGNEEETQDQVKGNLHCDIRMSWFN